MGRLVQRSYRPRHEGKQAHRSQEVSVSASPGRDPDTCTSIKNVLEFRLPTRATRDIRVHIRMVSRPSHRAQNDLTDVSMARDGCDKPKLSDCDKEERGGSNSRHKHLVRDRSSPDQGQTIDSILAHK